MTQKKNEKSNEKSIVHAGELSTAEKKKDVSAKAQSAQSSSEEDIVTLNGKKYISYMKYLELLEQSEKKNEQKSTSSLSEQRFMIDSSTCFAIGSVSLSETQYHVCHVSFQFLKKSLDIIKALGNDRISIAVCNDMPLCIGEFHPKTKTIAGMVIAPRIVDEDKND